jgi:hypothetical protein
MVRTTSNVIAGPYSKDQVIQLIRDGKLTHEDEVCRANHYWIFLHESDEVSRQLGIEMPRAARDSDDEDTQTETALTEPGSDLPDMPDVQESEHTTAIVRGSRHPAQPAAAAQLSPGAGGTHGASAHAGAAPPNGAHAGPAHAGATHTGAGHPGQGVPNGAYGLPPAPQPEADSNVMIERPSIWRGFAWLLIVVACLILFVVLRLLKMPLSS